MKKLSELEWASPEWCARVKELLAEAFGPDVRVERWEPIPKPSPEPSKPSMAG